MGLNDLYSADRSQLLMDFLSQVNRAYSILLQEECQRAIHLPLPTDATMHAYSKQSIRHHSLLRHPVQAKGHTAIVQSMIIAVNSAI